MSTTGILAEIENAPAAEQDPEALSLTALIDWTRALAKHLPEPYQDPDAMDKLQRELYQAIQALTGDLTARNLNPVNEPRHGLNLVFCEYHGKPRGMRELHVILQEETLHRQNILKAKEKEFIERHQGGGWQKLTRRTHGTGSGGEKAVALTFPQFAAAAAHYHNLPHAPRLIFLDAAFVGIDSDMRGKCMGLLEHFDLDFVMTSEREWGCYASIRGLAICQLAAMHGTDVVAISRWIWNGHARESAATPEPARPPADEPPKSEDDLFADPR